jgi:hypothetical protein
VRRFAPERRGSRSSAVGFAAVRCPWRQPTRPDRIKTLCPAPRRWRATPIFLDEGRIDEGAGCIKRLERLAAEYPAPTNCAWSDIHRYAAFGRAYLASAEERFEDAISILIGLRCEFESIGNRHLALRVQTHMAIVKFRAMQVAEAVDCFGDIVTVFARANIYQPVLDEGEKIGRIACGLSGQDDENRRLSRGHILYFQSEHSLEGALQRRAAERPGVCGC